MRDPLRRVVGGDVEGEVVALELVGELHQGVGRLGDVDADDRGAVAVQHPGDLLADAAAGAGDQGDLAVQRAQPVGHLADPLMTGVVGRRADPHDLAGDVRRLGREQEGQGAEQPAFGARLDVHELDRATAADLLAEGPGEALERALGDALGSFDRLGRRADHDQPRARLEAAHQRAEEVAQRAELGGVGEPGRVEEQAAVPRLWVGHPRAEHVDLVEQPRQRIGQPSGAPGEHGPGHERVARGVAEQWRRCRQAQVLGQEPADRGLDEVLVAVGHDDVVTRCDTQRPPFVISPSPGWPAGAARPR